MIEKFTHEELEQIVKEIKEQGVKLGYTPKGIFLRNEGREILGGDPFFTTVLGSGIFKIADFLTDNYEDKRCKNGKRKSYVGRGVPEGREEEYKRIIDGILEVIKPYYKKVCGFDDRNRHRSWGCGGEDDE